MLVPKEVVRSLCDSRCDQRMNREDCRENEDENSDGNSTVLVVESGLRAMGGGGATFGMVEQY